ncbi:hypothetical protein D3C85_191520 [compost metagenome]
MGFFEGLGKMFQGKPLFEDHSDHKSQVDPGDDPWRKDAESAAKESTTPEASLLVDEKGRKIIPEIRLERCKSYVNGNEMMVTAWATNAGNVEVELDKIEILGMRYELDRFLSPGKGHEVTLYKGPVTMDDSHDEATLHYKIVENGDYFAAEFMIEYNRESNGVYVVEELHPESVVRDI